jgi:hypothetical protein
VPRIIKFGKERVQSIVQDSVSNTHLHGTIIAVKPGLIDNKLHKCSIRADNSDLQGDRITLLDPTPVTLMKVNTLFMGSLASQIVDFMVDGL